MSDSTSSSELSARPRHKRLALLRKWLLIALLVVVVVMPLLVWVTPSGPPAPALADEVQP